MSLKYFQATHPAARQNNLGNASSSAEFNQRLLQCKNSIAPFGVNLSIGKTNNRLRIESLCKEVVLYTPYFQKRRLNALWLQDIPTDINELSAITEITYRLSTLFNRATGSDQIFGIQTTQASIQETLLNLLKGLGVNGLLIHFEANTNPPDWGDITLQLLGQFEFILCTLPSTSFARNKNTWQKFIGKLNPDVILYPFLQSSRNTKRSNTPQPSPGRPYQNNLKSIGYTLPDRYCSFLGGTLFTDCWINVDKHGEIGLLNKPIFQIKEWIALGLGSKGTIDNYFYQNTDSVTDYQSALDATRLPLQVFWTNS